MRLRLWHFLWLSHRPLPSAHADTFSNAFSDNGTYSSLLFPVAFTYTSSSLIMTYTTFVPTTCTYAPGPYVPPSSSIRKPRLSRSVLSSSPTESPAARYPIRGVVGSLTQLGTQNIDGQSLTITRNITPVSATPEPSGFVLLGTGMLGAIAAIRRRFIPQRCAS